MLNFGEPVAMASPVDMQEGLARLSRGAYFREASLELTLSLLTESAAQMTGVERVSIWALGDRGREIRCLDLYERGSGRHSSGVRLSAERYPAYFRALEAGSAIVADDAFVHPGTSEFAGDYLARYNIFSMLDTPIHSRGELQGVLCFEQVGRRQLWTANHRLLANAVANLVTLALVEYEATEARRQAQTANERLRTVFDASRDPMILADGDNGIVLDVNRQAEKLFGGTRIDLIGKHQRQLHPTAEEERCAREFRMAVSGESARPVRTFIKRMDGEAVAVEITAQVADLSDGRRLALGVFRPY